MIVIGTTAVFGYIVGWAERGAGRTGRLIEINPESTALSPIAQQQVREPAALALPRLRYVLRIFAEPKPAAPPDWYPSRGWPLWFVGFAFIYTRRAGGLFTLGLILNALVPIPLPWL